MHVIVARAPFVHRGKLDRDTMVQQPMRSVLDSSLLPHALQTNYRAAATRLDAAIAARLEAVGPVRQLRLHGDCHPGNVLRSEEHTSELQSLMRISYAVFCLKKKKHKNNQPQPN